MKLSVHWLVVDKTGQELDLIEMELHDISNAEIDRTDTPCKSGKLNARFRVRGDIDRNDLVDMCEFMNQNNAYPV